ncbi:MAG: GNAT family N-acetyltransferase [Gammaproteobacteria bacterium]|nr:GNAT family N-acetyltransferase [Gammaproteobacteria bacterium]
MADEIRVRPAEPGDMDEIQAIYAVEVLDGTASFELEPPSVDAMEQRRLALVDGGFPYLVAENGSSVVLGYAYAGPYRPRPAYRYTVENSVYVARSARRRGVARRLLSALIEACESRGYRQMVAVIGDSGHAASIRLHEQAGFRHVGTLERVGFKFERWLDTVIMQRVLGTPSGDGPSGD